ncbi:MAG: hypothetical protein K6A32_03120 [Bacteroidales bacterium]|nr:hypothetical protein [Bacteroidales bacterium]
MQAGNFRDAVEGDVGDKGLVPVTSFTIYTTSKLLGHTSVHTTEIYADVVMEKKADAVNLTNGLFG